MGNERRKSNSFYQNLENQDENETWIFTSPTQKRKLWFISLQEFLEIQTLVKVCIPPLWTNKTTQTANYNDSLAIERKSNKEKTTKPLFPPFVGAKQILTLKNCSQSPSSPPSPLSIQSTPIIDVHHQGQMYALYIRTSYTHVSGSRIIDACSIYASHQGYIHNWYIHHGYMHHQNMQHESMHHMCMHHIYTHNRRMHHGYMHRIMIHAAWTHASWYKWCIGIEEDKEVNIGWVTQPERLTSQEARRASS